MPEQNGDTLQKAFQINFLKEISCNLLQMPPNFLPKGSIDENPALFCIIALHGTGGKPAIEPVMDYLTNAYMRDKISVMKLVNYTSFTIPH